MTTDPFHLQCAHCSKSSRWVPYHTVWGKDITKIIKQLDFKARVIDQAVGQTIIAYCSTYCKWRHGKILSPIHRLLNYLKL